MPDSEMIEKIAKAIFMAELPFSGLRTYAPSTDPWAIAQRSTKRQYLAQARAAIEAMMEPTEAMISFANETVRPDSDNAQCPDFYRAMLSEALSPSLKEQEEGN